MLTYTSTYNPAIDEASTGANSWNLDPWLYSCRIRVWGAGGGGEFISNPGLFPTAGDNGGDSSIFGVTAEGGDGGGRLSTGAPSKNNGGAGGSTSFSNNPDWGSLGVSITALNGAGGTLSAGGLPGFSSGLRGRGGNGSNGLRTYTSTSTHIFNNFTNQHTFTSTSSDISVAYINPNAPDSIFGTTPFFGKHYLLTFNEPYKNNNWTFSIYNICQQAAAGASGGTPYTVNGTNNKSSSGIRIWFQTGFGANTYIRCFTLQSTGIKVGAEGRGGGAGGFIEFELTRQNLIDAGYNMNPYNLDGTQRQGDLLNYVIGAGGTSSVAAGRDGRVEIIYYEIPQVYLVASSYAVVAGTSVNLQWETFGDADSLEFISGDVTNTNLTSNVNVNPLDTTIYTAQASGIAGTSFNTEASVTIIVYQVPIVNSLDTPVSVDYGDSFIISYDVEYVNIDVRVEIFYNYDDGNGFQLEDTVDIPGNLSDSAQIGVGNTNAQDTQSFDITYNNQGPRSVQLLFYFEGDGGVIIENRIIPINIDETPDNIIIPETDDAFKEQDPVYSPNIAPADIILSDLLEIQGVDIPVEIKANYPIKVILNNDEVLRNVREI